MTAQDATTLTVITIILLIIGFLYEWKTPLIIIAAGASLFASMFLIMLFYKFMGLK